MKLLCLATVAACLSLAGCSQLSSDVAKFNAVAGPRLTQDAQVAGSAAATGAASETTAQLTTGGGQLNPTAIGASAATAAVLALANLDISRATGSATAAIKSPRLRAWLAALHSKHPDWERTYRIVRSRNPRRHFRAASVRLTFAPLDASRIYAVTPFTKCPARLSGEALAEAR